MIIRVVTLAASFVVGIILAAVSATPVPSLLLLLLAATGCATTLYLAWGETKWRQWPQTLIVFFAILWALPLGYWRTESGIGSATAGSLESRLNQLDSGTAVRLRGTIHQEPELRDGRNADLNIRVSKMAVGSGEWETVQPGNVLCRATVAANSKPDKQAALYELVDPRAFGYTVEVDANFQPPRPVRHPGEFDYERFLQQSGITASFRVPVGNIRIIERSKGNPLLESALWAKRRFIAVYRMTIRNPASRLVAAATLGSRRAVENVDYKGMDIVQAFRHAGVGHVLAVSGLHVSVISLLLYSLFRILGMRPRTFAPILIACLILFALLTGARPSSVRAVVMNSVILIAFAYFRYTLRSATYIGLAGSALVILTINPLVLLAPSFLLSYGAVMSLVLIAPTLDRWICRLRGFALLFAFLWFCILIGIAMLSLAFFFQLRNCLGMAGLLWLLLVAGGALNQRFPLFWHIGLERIPRIIRLMISAQVAIQLGMMIPLSCWFFGQFPVAGALVNFIAIPAIGVLVQLGMLVGLIGLIPVVGTYLATPFGIADSLVGEFFFRLAHAGSTAFPFPATPKPTLLWMAGYYVGLALLLSIEKWRIPVQGWFYRYSAKKHGALVLRTVVYLAIAILLGLPLTALLPRSRQCKTVTCFATGRYPLIAATSDDKRAITINAGDKMDGERLLFEVIRTQGATSIDKAILTSPSPDAGNEGLAALSTKMHIKSCALPLNRVAPDAYLETIGDGYMLSAANRNKSWVKRYVTAYALVDKALREQGTDVQLISTEPLVKWDNLLLEALLPPAIPPGEISVRKITPVIRMQVEGFRWLIVTDGDADSLKNALPATGPAYDVLVLPELSSRKTFRGLIDTAVHLARPRIVIMTGDREPTRFFPYAWAEHHRTFLLMTGARDGAVLATFPGEGIMRLKGHLSGLTLTLRNESRPDVAELH